MFRISFGSGVQLSLILVNLLVSKKKGGSRWSSPLTEDDLSHRWQKLPSRASSSNLNCTRASALQCQGFQRNSIAAKTITNPKYERVVILLFRIHIYFKTNHLRMDVATWYCKCTGLGWVCISPG